MVGEGELFYTFAFCLFSKRGVLKDKLYDGTGHGLSSLVLLFLENTNDPFK